eukprot:8625159-Pyramimonas_sp.AAC.1
MDGPSKAMGDISHRREPKRFSERLARLTRVAQLSGVPFLLEMPGTPPVEAEHAPRKTARAVGQGGDASNLVGNLKDSALPKPLKNGLIFLTLRSLGHWQPSREPPSTMLTLCNG